MDTELFNGNVSTRPREELGLDQAFVLGYVGVLREWVDFEHVFAAVKGLENEKPDIKVLIVGEEGGLTKNKTLAQKYGISDKVVFTGTVSYTQVPAYISCMDVCLLPFKNDAVSHNALPLKLFEYMACEKPVISTRLERITEAVQDKVLYTSNTEELERRITELFENEDRRRKMGLEGRKFVEENYSWAKICPRLEEVLVEVASLKD